MDKKIKTLTNQISRLTEKISIRSVDSSLPIDKGLKSLGFIMLSTGCDRRVYVNRKLGLVLKLATGSCSDQNYTEIKFWNAIENMEDSPRKKLLKSVYNNILAYDKMKYKWILAPLAQTYDDDKLTNEQSYDIANDLKSKLVKLGMFPYDIHNQNVGILNGQPVIIDYGCETFVC